MRISLYKGARLESPFGPLGNPQVFVGVKPVRSIEIEKKVFILGK
jgi:hypothetical protein